MPSNKIKQTTPSLEIGAFDENKKAIYAGNLHEKDLWVSLHDALEQMNWEDAKKWCEEQGGYLPSIDELTVAFLNKDAINKALEEHGGEPFEEDDWYWSSSECNNYYSWLLYMSNGNRLLNGKRNTNYVRCFQLL